MKKLAIVINGRGGAGKDTLCGIAAAKYKTVNVSTITPIKKIAKNCGWNGEKTRKSRKFLADLKKIVTEYSDLPNNYALGEYKMFLGDPEAEIFFVHIREAKQITRFLKTSSLQTEKCRTITLLIKSERQKSPLGNRADDNVEDYPYDYIYENNLSLDEVSADFLRFLEQIYEKETSV